MALIKEDYGLIYNDDGSLCVTVRDDDTPFQGVKSFAVEEATENLVNNPLNLLGIGWYTTNANIIKENEWYKLTSLANDICYLKQDFNMIENTYYTLQVKVKVTDFTGINDVRLMFSSYTSWENGHGGETIFDLQNEAIIQSYSPSPTIKKINENEFLLSITSYSILNGESRVNIAINGNVDSFVYIKEVQFEKKPFATSFVDGSRPGGGMRLILNSVKNWVFSFWYKNIYGGTSNYESLNIKFLEDNGYFVVRKGWNNKNIFLSEDETINNTIMHVDDTDNSWKNWLFVFSNDTNELKIYINGVLKTTITTLDFTRSLQKIDIYGRANGLYSNLFIGEYKDKNGNVIWTDEYIQEVYEAKKPFNTNL